MGDATYTPFWSGSFVRKKESSLFDVSGIELLFPNWGEVMMNEMIGASIYLGTYLCNTISGPLKKYEWNRINCADGKHYKGNSVRIENVVGKRVMLCGIRIIRYNKDDEASSAITVTTDYRGIVGLILDCKDPKSDDEPKNFGITTFDDTAHPENMKGKWLSSYNAADDMYACDIAVKNEFPSSTVLDSSGISAIKVKFCDLCVFKMVELYN